MKLREDSPQSGDIILAPHWRVRCHSFGVSAGATDREPCTIQVEAGPGFGNGSHETTQLCLLALGHLLRLGPPEPRVLDFGAGSGILSVAAAKLGALVEAVEIDAAAREHARRVAELNGVSARVAIRGSLAEPAERFDLVVANILRSVLVDFAEALAVRTSPKGSLVLSGLVATDVPHILARYSGLFVRRTAQVYERGVWRAVLYPPEAAR